MNKLVRRGGSLDVIDTAVGIAAVIIVGFLILNVLGWIAGTLFFLFKVAVIALVIAVAVRFLSGRRRDW